MRDELGKLTAREIARLVAEKQVSPVETTRAAIERIEQRNPSLNAVIFTDFDGAHNNAKQLETKIMRGDKVGPMAGVPTLMKDLFDFKPGWPSTFGGVPALKDFISDVWSAYPLRTERDDAIMLGKTNSTVLGFCGTSDNPLFGATRNPFDLKRNSGGSSGGSAAAVADGIVSVAGASDGGGSIRIPSSWSGTAGFQPSYGRIPVVMRPNAFAGASSFAYEGPVARTVGDLALAMNSLVGFDPLDPFSSPGFIDFDAALQGSIKGKRIAFTTDFGIFPVDVRVVACVSEAVKAFELAGAIVEPVNLKIPYDQNELYQLLCRLISLGYFAFIEGMKEHGIDFLTTHRSQLPEELLVYVERAAKMTVKDLQGDQMMRTQVFDALTAIFEQYDYIVSPTTAALPVLNAVDGETIGPSEINGVAIDPRIGWCMTYMTNMSGHPAASLPAGLADGLPVGLQIIGRRHGDFDLMVACAEFEKARPWAHIYELTKARSLQMQN